MRCDRWKDRDFLEIQKERCDRSPKTYEQIGDVIDLFEVYSEISHLSMWAARPLVYEKNLKVKRSAITEIAREIAIRSDTNQNLSIRRSLVTEGRVQEILSEKRILIEGTDIQREKLAKRKANREVKDKELLKRDKIVSLRVTEELDEGLDWLALRLDVSRSLLVSILLEYRIKFPGSF
jgi:hypothetical protein